MKNWQFKIVKMSRGTNGQWFSHRTAATFADFASAVQYAQEFHAEQYAALGLTDSHQYCVVPRRSGGDEVVFRSLWSPETCAVRASEVLALSIA